MLLFDLFSALTYIPRRHAHLLEVVEEVSVGAHLLCGAAVETLPVLLAVLGVRVVERELDAVVRGALRGDAGTFENHPS